MTGTNVQGEIVNIQIPNNNNKYSWVSPVITTVIGILVAIGLTWYQINRAEQEEQKVDIERIKTVKNTMVSIVEDHVINNQPISISRLSRLVDIKSREANIKITPRLLEIIQIAELNIINSGYLDFQTKNGYKKVFDSIYDAMRKEYKVDYIDNKNSVLIDQLISSIKVGNSEESISSLQLLVEAYSVEINELELKANRKSDLDRLSDLISDKPLFVLGISFVYIIFIIMFFPRFRKIMRIFIDNKEQIIKEDKNTIKVDSNIV